MVEVKRRWNVIAWKKCPWCIKAQSLLEQHEQDYSVQYCERGTQKLEEAKSRNNWNTVPMITLITTVGESVSEKFIGGFDSLSEYFGGEEQESGACSIDETTCK